MVKVSSSLPFTNDNIYFGDLLVVGYVLKKYITLRLIKFFISFVCKKNYLSEGKQKNIVKVNSKILALRIEMLFKYKSLIRQTLSLRVHTFGKNCSVSDLSTIGLGFRGS